MEDPVIREAIKGASALTLAGLGAAAPVAAALVLVTGVSIEYLGAIGAKRTSELFDSEEFVNSVKAKIELSDDFGSFVFSLWQKHNLESHERRRKLLKAFLEHETHQERNSFENFSKLEHVIQNISFNALALFKLLYSDIVTNREIDPQDSASRLLNMPKIYEFIKAGNVSIAEHDLENYLNELSYFGLIGVRHNRMGGPYYDHVKMGHIFKDYMTIDFDEREH